jgi:hypothetical protein
MSCDIISPTLREITAKLVMIYTGGMEDSYILVGGCKSMPTQMEMCVPMKLFSGPLPVS